MAPPARGASLQLVTNDWGASGMPTNLSMYIYVPDNLAPNPPILVLLHYWGGGASGVFAEAVGGGIVAAADQYGFIMVVPQNPDCWDYGSAQSLTHDGGGQTQGIARMVKYTINTYQANSNRVYVTGTSCGGMMTEALLAVYPDIFQAGAEFAGVPAGASGWGGGQITITPQQWGDLVRAMYPGYSGRRPRVQLWHGTADGTVNYTNQLEAIKEWSNVLGISTNPTSTATVIVPNITNQWMHQVWKDTNGGTLLDAWSEIGGGHGTDANLSARYVIPFLGLDKVGPVDLGAGGQRGRPKLNAASTTFVADNGQPLRGPYTSTEWTGATSYDQIAKMKGLGFNAVHLYGESFDPSYPTNGSTAPGYATNRIDSIVQSTRDLGLYLVITIGNGAANGKYNRAYITNFWNLYSARYANETHVMFEIQNEPVAWGPPYSAANATPPGGLDMEVAAYRTIRQYAPDTPVLLFTYAVLGGTGGANAALTDIHAFNQTVFGNQNAVWTNTAVGFHGYAGAGDTAIAVSNILSARYPCFMTEFGSGTWGGGPGGLDVEAVANLERLGVSWLTFQYIPPTGVSDDVTKPDCYSNRVVNAGLSWTPDYGTFPVARSVFGNGGYPWTTPDYNNNVLSGTLRIEAENFDNGGKGVAYYNTNATNPGGQYRTNETVGIQATSDTGGGYNVGWTAAGDWLEYTMKISSAGTYNLRLRVAGTSAGSVQVLANGTDLTGGWALPNTGGAQTWRTVTNTVFLKPGQQKLHINVLAGGFNLNWIELSPVPTGPVADGTYKILNAASALALDIDTNNVVVTATPAGSNNQQWSLRHIGGGQYEVSSVAKGNSWTAWMGPLHLQAWGWGAGGDSCYIFQPTGGGYYRFFTAGGGASFEPSTGNAPALDQNTWTGAADQQWAILAPSAPVFPTGLSAVAATSTQANLTWNAVIGAASYNVKRSTNGGGAYTTIATGVTTTNYTDNGLAAGVKYYYVVSAVSGGVESLNSAEAALRFPKLTGTIIGTLGSWGNSGNTITNVFDNNLNTFFDAPTGNGCWVGLDFGVGVSNIITQINYCPRSGFESRMVGGIFQGANQASFSDALTLGTVGTQPAAGGFTSVSITNAAAFRYVRFLSPDGGYGNVAELEFCGYSTFVLGPIPSGLIALASSATQINLTWNALTNATSYNLKCSTTSGGPYTTVASGITTTNYTDTVPAGMKYYYVVSAICGGQESLNSREATVNLPYPWVSQDVGAVGLAGSASYGNGVFTVAGAGGDIQGTADAFQFVYVPVTGNCAIVARVASVQDIDAWSKAGVMIRESLNTDAANAFVAVTPGNGVTWQYRASTGGGTSWNNTNGLSAPYWVKLVRSGSTFTGYRSPDGTNWTLQGSATITMGSAVYAGLALTSHNNSSLGTATFDNVTAPGWPSPMPPPAPSGLAATAWNAQATLTWAGSGTATSYNVKRATTNGGPYTIAANVTTTNYTDTGLTNGAIYYYVVSALNPAGESANSTGVSATPQVPAPAAPTGLVAAAVSSSQINLAWNAVTNAANYNVRRSTTNGGPYVLLATGVTVTNYTDTGLAGSTTYYYVVSAVNAGGESTNSAQVSATTTVGPPAAPAGLTATAVSSFEISLSWTASAGAVGYNLRRSTTSGGPYLVVATGLTATNYPDSGLVGGTVYYYVVSAVNSGGESGNSAQASATTLSPTLDSLVHRYSFGETGGVTVADSVGGPVWNGTLPNGGTLSGGQLALASGSQQYASLPAGIVASLTNATVMAWVNLASVSYWSRIFDFGNDTSTYMYLTPRNGFDYTTRFVISTSGAAGEQKINCGVTINPGAWHQVAVTLNSGTGVLYVDGMAVGSNTNLTISPLSLGNTTHNYLGKSQSTSDPYLNGSLDEFRIYNVALSAAEIAATAALGPDQLLSSNSPTMSLALTGTDLTVSWPLANAGFTLQSSTNLALGDWMNVPSPAPQIVGGQWQVALPQPGAASSAFYRLVK